jgi:hypothetical protein
MILAVSKGGPDVGSAQDTWLKENTCDAGHRSADRRADYPEYDRRWAKMQEET